MEARTRNLCGKKKVWNKISSVYVLQQLGCRPAQPGDVSFYSEGITHKKQWQFISEL